MRAKTSSTAKQRLRSVLRAERRGFATAAQHAASAGLARIAATLPELASASVVAGYMANDGELDLGPLLAELVERRLVVLLPRRRADRTELAPWDGSPAGVAASGPGRTLEPTAPPIDVRRLPRPAVLLAPSVALDRAGNRLGRGGGDYDRLIASLPRSDWTIIGVCHAAHLLDRLPDEPHDQPVDVILTETAAFRPGRS